MVVNCDCLSIPLSNSSVLPGVKLYGVYLTFLITATVICCLSSLILFPSSVRSIRFIISCVVLGSPLIRSVVRYGIIVARYNSFFGSNALFCCDRYRWSLDDLLCSNNNPSNFTIANFRNNLVSDKMKQAALFLYETLCIREGFFDFCHESNFLSKSQVNDMCFSKHVNDCMLLHIAHSTQCTLLRSLLMFVIFVVLRVRFL